jgi:tetratricopeptide (TPR) repeat protein
LRKVIALKPDFAPAYLNLGSALIGLKKYAEAEAVLRKAIDLQPDYAEAYCNLGNALGDQQRHAEAVAAYRKAIDLKPDFAFAYNNLGIALSAMGKHREAEAALQKAIDLDPSYVSPHHNLGNARVRQQKWREAEAAYRKAIDLDPGLDAAHYSLGMALMRQSRFNEAARSLKKASELIPTTHPGRGWARQARQLCQRYAALAPRLPAILQGTEKPKSAAEQIEFARLCQFKKLHATAARLFRDAFTAEPKLADDVRGSARYDAACAAALAGCGKGGQGADKLNDKERAHWRRQALQWLRQDLTWWGKTLEDGGHAQTRADVRQKMQHWQADSDLAGLRNPGALEALSADERKECLALWREVADLLGRVQTTR